MMLVFFYDYKDFLKEFSRCRAENVEPNSLLYDEGFVSLLLKEVKHFLRCRKLFFSCSLYFMKEYNNDSFSFRFV